MEDNARRDYLTHLQRNHPDVKVENCGLFISRLNNWLGASPDGIVYDPSETAEPSGLLEIKNPFSVKDNTSEEACMKSAFCLEINKETNRPQLKHRHDFQCQLYCADKNWADFVLRTNRDIHIQQIQRDRGVQLSKLRKFYFTSLLPELACHRHGGIREPATTS